MPTELQPRLEPDVAKSVRESAEKNGRSIPGEVNYALREYYGWMRNSLRVDWKDGAGYTVPVLTPAEIAKRIGKAKK